MVFLCVSANKALEPSRSFQELSKKEGLAGSDEQTSFAAFEDTFFLHLKTSALLDSRFPSRAFLSVLSVLCIFETEFTTTARGRRWQECAGDFPAHEALKFRVTFEMALHFPRTCNDGIYKVRPATDGACTLLLSSGMSSDSDAVATAYEKRCSLTQGCN